MKRKQLNLAVLGAGMRPHQILGKLISLGPEIRIGAIFDPDREMIDQRLQEWDRRDARIAASAEEAINGKDINLVMIFSPNAYHCDHILSAFKAGKSVFTEKPLVTNLDDCTKIMTEQRRTGLPFATGFVLRYTPIYRKVHELINAGTIGRILSIDANENLCPRHGTYIMCNWRRFSRLAGPHILEKCCHDLDLMNWFIGSIPRQVASFGGRDFFKPENSGYYRKFIDPADRIEVFKSTWEKTEAGDDPFLIEKDIFDNQVAIIEYRNNVRVQFQTTISNAIPERRMYFSGTEGTLIVELFSGTVRVRRIDQIHETTYRFETSVGHAGGDEIIMRDLYDMVFNGKNPQCSGREGMLSTATALAIQKAAEENRIIDMEPIWEMFEKQNLAVV